MKLSAHIYKFAADAVTVGPDGKITFDKGTFIHSSGDVLGLFGTVANLLVFITGSVSIIMVIIGGLRYVISQGNPANTKAAKDTILYALVGLGVALSAFAIITFVRGAIK